MENPGYLGIILPTLSNMSPYDAAGRVAPSADHRINAHAVSKQELQTAGIERSFEWTRKFVGTPKIPILIPSHRRPDVTCILVEDFSPNHVSLAWDATRRRQTLLRVR